LKNSQARRDNKLTNEINDEARVSPFSNHGDLRRGQRNIVVEPRLRKRVSQFLVLHAQFG
jgi:hypothetical protein